MTTTTQASEPGHPLGADDFVFLIPGLSATEFLPRGCGYPWCWSYPPGSQTPYELVVPPIDTEGQQYAFREERLVNCVGTDRFRRYLVRLRSDRVEEDVAYVEERCVPNTTSAVDKVWFQALRADNNNGCLYVLITTQLNGNTSPGGASYPAAPSNESLVRICGLATTFEILQTYTPTTSELSFRVPYMPEGFPAADYFDTYYGDLATVGDWSQAHPLQCGYPSTPPSVGDYLTVADTLPDPAPGTGRYYVTGVTHQGQRRYGRKATNGVLSGRDPAVLPGCTR
jgi:hypothetical protein